ETVIDATIEEIWPHLVHIESWMSEYRLETLEGKAGEEGYFQRVFPPVEDSMPPPHYHYYGIARIIPGKLVALETFREIGGSYGRTREGMNLDLITVTAIDGGRTKVSMLMVDIEIG